MAQNNEIYILTLIDSNLLPTFKAQNTKIIITTVQFAERYLMEKICDSDSEISLMEFKKILFGLACTDYDKNKIKNIIESVLDYNHNEIENLLTDLKNEYEKNKIQFALNTTSSLGKNFFTITEWGKFLLKYFTDIMQNVLFELSSKEEKELHEGNIIKITSPQNIKDMLDKYYVGSEEVKTTLSRIFYEHYLSIILNGKNLLPKRNLLLIGPSGSGKSYVIQRLSEIVSLPFLIYDSTKLTQRGIVGDKIENVLYMLYQKAGSLEKMNGGIIFFDEIDKLCYGEYTSKNDVSTIGVQQDLLRFIEGDNYEFYPKGESKSDKVSFNTSNLLIIAGGAFEGIENIIKNRQKKIGFEIIPEKKFIEQIELADLIAFGMSKQLAARFQIISVLPERTIEHLMDILINVKDSITKIYIDYFRFHGCELNFNEEGIRKIAELAFEKNIGARGLIKIIEDILPMYELGNKELKSILINKEYIEKKIANKKTKLKEKM